MTKHPTANIPIGGVKCSVPLHSVKMSLSKKPTNEASFDAQGSSLQQ